jgi:hypothetical protein
VLGWSACAADANDTMAANVAAQAKPARKQGKVLRLKCSVLNIFNLRRVRGK